MKFKNKLFAVCLLALVVVVPANAQDSGSILGVDASELTGDTKLACEAILCLSSSSRPGECAPSIDRYFDIKKKKWSDTRKARKNFLNLCPASSEPGMPDLIAAISEGAGFCGAAQLNQNTVYVYRTYRGGRNQWSEWRNGKPDEYTECNNSYRYYYGCVELKKVIDNNMPSRCINLINNQMTYYDHLRYVGDKYNGGHWVDGVQ